MKSLMLALLIAFPRFLQADLLAEFSCVRPAGFDQGTWHNVSLAAGLVNGAVIASGETFSFLKAIAPGRENYLPGNTYSDGRIIKTKGGGYCQVSAAIYNAVLLAALPVLERYPHSFYDEAGAYCPPGLDAAVSSSNRADFRFLNNTGSALTITALAMEGRVSVQIFGSGPLQKRWVSTETLRIPMRRRKKAGYAFRPGHDGLKVRRTLHTLDASGNTKSVFLGTDHYMMVTHYD